MPSSYVQAFDPKTGVSMGPSEPLFLPPTLNGLPNDTLAAQILIYSAAVAPTGDIALVYELRGSVGGESLYCILEPVDRRRRGIRGAVKALKPAATYSAPSHVVITGAEPIHVGMDWVACVQLAMVPSAAGLASQTSPFQEGALMAPPAT
jgi:hypothetical protein